jgi:hypothetical protein
MAMLSLSNFLAAQANFFTLHSSSEVNMSLENQKRHQKLLDENNGDVKIVSVAKIDELVSDTLRFSLPLSETFLEVVGDIVSEDKEFGLMWSGRIINQMGYVCLVSKKNQTGGFIQVGSDFFEIYPIDENYQFLVKTKGEGFKPCGDSKQVIAPISPNPEPDKCSYPTGYNPYNTCPAVISVLLVITNEARARIEANWGSFFGVPLFAALGQMSVNYAFYNSDIPNKEVKVKCVFADLQNSISGDYVLDKPLLPNILGSLRAANNADIAFLLVHKKIPIAGFVQNFGPNNSTQGFGVLEAEPFLREYVFAHELGHLIGCRHNWPINYGDDDTAICAHAKRHIPTPNNVDYDHPEDHTYNVESWMTIMGKPFELGPYIFENINGYYYANVNKDYRILHYSNPSVYYGNEATGTATGYIADNAKSMRNDACNVSLYSVDQELSFAITTTTCKALPYNLTTLISPPTVGLLGQGPYQVKWYWNTTGLFNFNQYGQPNFIYLGEGTTLSLAQHPSCPVYWIKCFVVSSDGTLVSRIRKIDLTGCDCEGKSGNRSNFEYSQSNPTVKSILNVLPNPTLDGKVIIYSMELKNTSTNLTISSVDGKVQSNFYQQFDEEGTSTLNLDYPSGVYVITSKLPSGLTNSTKLIILKN